MLTRPRADDVSVSGAGQPGSTLVAAALTYGLLLAFSAGLYVTVLAVGGVRDGHLGPMWLHVLAGVLVVGTAAPVRRWLRSSVEDVVYSHHADAYGAMRSLHHELESEHPPTTSPLPTIVARSVNIPYVAIEVPGQEPQVHGELVPGTTPVRLPIAFGESQFGWFAAGPRRRGIPLGANDIQLLQDLFGQVAVSLLAQRAAAEVLESRAALVTAREEERRRIRRDLHDGLGPSLAALQLELAAVHRLLPTDPTRAALIVGELRGDVRATAADIRRLVYDLRPPRLDDLGLVGALRNLWSARTPVLEVEAGPGAQALPAAIEVAIYRIAGEAVQNVVKHAGAQVVSVSITVSDDRVRLAVSDDGRGLPSPLVPGVGMLAMRERAAELGGDVSVTSGGTGTQVLVDLPIRGSSGG